MAIINDIEDLLKEFGVNINNDTRSSLKRKLNERASRYGGRSRTSRLEASIKPSVSYSGGVMTFRLTMNDYWEVVDKGRKAAPVSKEGQQKIADWSGLSGLAEKIRLKDLETRKAKSKGKGKLRKMPFERAKKSAGFLVARKLKSKSLDGTEFFTEIVNDGRIEELQEKLTELIKTDIIIEIRNGINNTSAT